MTPLQNAIKSLHEQFLTYCADVEQNVHLAIQSFMKTEPKNIEIVIQKDREINQKEIAIEEECLKIIAMYQPVAKDLRMIVGILKMNNDLERIGDLAVNIVKKVNIFSKEHTSLVEQGNIFLLPEMIEKVLNMLKKSLDAFTKKDPDAAREVCRIDDEVDKLKHEIKAIILKKIKEDPEHIELLSGILRNSYHLERIADLATNIAEDVIYLVEGAIIRHGAGTK